MTAPGIGFTRTRVWLVDLDAAMAVLDDLSSDMPPPSGADRADLEGGANLPALRRLTAHRALRVAIAHHFGRGWAGAPIITGEHGKPGIASLPGDFSLSHSGGWALLATTDQTAIGVDLELPRAVLLSPPRTAAMITAARLASSDPDAIGGILDAWVRLEAIAKATGEGIGATLAALGVRGRTPLPVAPPPDWPRARGIDLTGQVTRDGYPFTAAAALPARCASQPIVVRALPMNRNALNGLLG